MPGGGGMSGLEIDGAITAYSLIAVQKKTQSLNNVGHAFWLTAGECFAYIKKSVKLIEERFFWTDVFTSFIPVLYQLQTFPFFIFLRFGSLNFATAGAGAGARKKKYIQKGPFP